MHMDSKSLSASVDLGSSLTKVIYAEQGQAQPLIMPPETAWVQSQQLDELSINKTTAAEYSAWLQLNDEVIAVLDSTQE